MPVPSLESSLPWVPIDGLTAIEEDIPCRQCSYNLRGIDCTGRCPECGAPAELSIHGDLLRHSDPAWLRKLARGVRIMLLAMALILVVTVATITLLRR